MLGGDQADGARVGRAGARAGRAVLAQHRAWPAWGTYWGQLGSLGGENISAQKKYFASFLPGRAR